MPWVGQCVVVVFPGHTHLAVLFRGVDIKLYNLQKMIISFLGTDVSPFPNFNNSVLTTRRNLLLHC